MYLKNSKDKDIDSINSQDKRIGINKNKLIKKGGSSFHDIYIKQKKIGSGGYGTVYLVTHKQLKVKRALKVIQKYSGGKSNEQQLQLLKSLDHPNILKIYQYFETSQQYYLIIQYFQGKQIFTQIIQNKFLSQKKVILIIYQILKALNYIHNKNIAHRDIKAQNILIKSNQQGQYIIKLIDWGLSSLMSNKKFNRKCGTTYYMAPQVIQGNYGIQCDMWSLGVLVYTMLIGTFPFGGKTQQQTIQSIKTTQIKLNNPLWNNISQDGRNFILSLLQRDPKKRITSKQSLNHKWILSIRNQQQKYNNNLQQAFTQLKSFHTQNKLQLLIFNYIYNFINHKKQQQKLIKQFQKFDKDNNGQITLQQFKIAYQKVYHIHTDLIIQEIFANLDLDHNGYITYSQYITFASKKDRQFTKEEIRQAFRLFDSDQDGYIEKTQMRSLFDVKIDPTKDKEILNALDEIDLNGDGKFDFEEFIQHINDSLQESRKIQTKQVINSTKILQ